MLLFIKKLPLAIRGVCEHEVLLLLLEAPVPGTLRHWRRRSGYGAPYHAVGYLVNFTLTCSYAQACLTCQPLLQRHI
jgi:hypothetical protein